MHEGDDLPPAVTEAPLDPLFESSSGDLNLDTSIEPIPQPAIQPEILPPDRIDPAPPSSPATALDDEDELPF